MALPLKRDGLAAAFLPIPAGLMKARAGVLWGYLRMNMAPTGGPAKIENGFGPPVLPDERRIGKDLGATPRTIRRWVRALEASGWLVCRRAGGGGRGDIVERWAVLAGREAVVNDLALPTKADNPVPLLKGERRTKEARKADKKDHGRRTKMSAHNIMRHTLEIKREGGGAAAMPSGPPPAADGNGHGNDHGHGNGHDQTLAELRAVLTGLQKPWLPDGGATGRRISKEIAEIERLAEALLAA